MRIEELYSNPTITNNYTGLPPNIEAYYHLEGLSNTTFIEDYRSLTSSTFGEQIHQIADFITIDSGEKVNDAASSVFFSTVEAARVALRSPKFPWQEEYLKQRGETEWTRELSNQAPSERELARQWLFDIFLPRSILERMTILSHDETEQHQLHIFITEIEKGVDKYLHGIPGKIGLDSLLTMFYTVGSAFPEYMPVVSGIGATLSANKARVVSNSSDSLNDLRRLSPIIISGCNAFFQRRSRKEILQAGFSHPNVPCSEAVNNGLGRFLTEVETLDAQLNLVGKVIGSTGGSILNAALFRSLPSIPLGIGGGILTYALHRKAVRNQAKFTTQFQEKQRRFFEARSEYERAVASNSPDADEQLERVLREKDELTTLVNPNNRYMYRLMEQFPWIVGFFSGLPALLNGGSTNVETGSLFVGSLLGQAAMSHAWKKVGLDLSRNGAAIQYEIWSNALTYIEGRFNQIDTQEKVLPIERPATFKQVELNNFHLKDGTSKPVSNFIVRPGVNLLTGDSGSGKTTALDYIADPFSSGKYVTILVDGQPVSSMYTKQEWDKNISSAVLAIGSQEFLGQEIINRIRRGKAKGICDYIIQNLESRNEITLAQQFLNDGGQEDFLREWSETFLLSNGARILSDRVAILEDIVTSYFQQFVKKAQRFWLTQRIGHQALGSFGESNRIGLALALADTNAKILLLDEPNAGLEGDDLQIAIDALCRHIIDHPEMMICIATRDKKLLTALAQNEFYSKVVSRTNMEAGVSLQIEKDDKSIPSIIERRQTLESNLPDITLLLNEVSDISASISGERNEPAGFNNRILDIFLQIHLVASKMNTGDYMAHVGNFQQIISNLFTSLIHYDEMWRDIFKNCSFSDRIGIAEISTALELIKKTVYLFNRVPDIRIDSAGLGGLKLFGETPKKKWHLPPLINTSHIHPDFDNILQGQLYHMEDWRKKDFNTPEYSDLLDPVTFQMFAHFASCRRLLLALHIPSELPSYMHASLLPLESEEYKSRIERNTRFDFGGEKFESVINSITVIQRMAILAISREEQIVVSSLQGMGNIVSSSLRQYRFYTNSELNFIEQLLCDRNSDGTSKDLFEKRQLELALLYILDNKTIAAFEQFIETIRKRQEELVR